MTKEDLRFIPKPTGFSTISHRFWLVVSFPFRRTLPGLVFATTFWLITYNVGVRMTDWELKDGIIQQSIDESIIITTASMNGILETYNISIHIVLNPHMERDAMWKGPHHPVNRFQWRKMEKGGTLPDELLQKKRTVLDYYKSRFFGGESSPISMDIQSHI